MTHLWPLNLEVSEQLQTQQGAAAPHLGCIYPFTLFAEVDKCMEPKDSGAHNEDKQCPKSKQRPRCSGLSQRTLPRDPYSAQTAAR